MTRGAALWTGIAKHGAGWRASVSQGRGRAPLRRTFPANTDPQDMQAWRVDAAATVQVKQRGRRAYGTFAGDADRYLRAVTALPTYTDRVREINVWKQVFGDTPRDRITPVMIREQRDRWLVAPRAKKKPPLAPATINKRLRALSNLWAVLDGSRAPNPVREVPEAQEPDAPDRALEYTTIAAILGQLPDVGRSEKRKAKRPAASKTKARIRVLAYTGWPNATLAALTDDDVDLDLGIARLPARRKGKGAKGVVVPLLPEAVDALKEFARLDCWGPFSRSSLRKSFLKAARRAGVKGAVRPYDLRHSFLTQLALDSKDEGAVQAIAQHGDARTTKRYTQGSVPARVAHAVGKFSTK